MDEVYQYQPLSMSFCLDCHRDPAAKLRPPDKITDLDWKWSNDPEENARQQALKGKEMVAQRSEEHTSELQSLRQLVCRLLREKKKTPPPAPTAAVRSRPRPAMSAPRRAPVAAATARRSPPVVAVPARCSVAGQAAPVAASPR